MKRNYGYNYANTGGARNEKNEPEKTIGFSVFDMCCVRVLLVLVKVNEKNSVGR